MLINCRLKALNRIRPAMTYFLELLRFAVIPGTMIAFYFGFLRVGYKVGVSYTFRHNRTEASGIGEVVLTNLKDRSTPIFALYALHDGVAIQLIQFDTPMVLKSFDSVKIDIPPVSEYLVDGVPFEFTELSKDGFIKTSIYYSTIKRFKKCIPLSPPSRLPTSLLKSRSLKLATVVRNLFNGRVYSPSVIYIIEYRANDEWGDAFVDAGGLIHWRFSPNGIPVQILSDPQMIADTLLGQMQFIQQLSIRKTQGWNRHFSSSETFKSGTDDVPIVGNRNANSH